MSSAVQIPFPHGPASAGAEDVAPNFGAFQDVTTAVIDTGLLEDPAERCPCILLLDTSASMDGQPIRELTDGFAAFHSELAGDELARRRVEVSVVTFGGDVTIKQDFARPDAMQRMTFRADGGTPMGEAVVTALDLLERRKASLRQAAVPYYQPWIFLITDGAPTDYGEPAWEEAVRRVNEEVQAAKLSFFAVGVHGANLKILAELNRQRQPVKLRGLMFRELFQWLTASLTRVAASKPGDAVPLDNPAAPNGWAQA